MKTTKPNKNSFIVEKIIDVRTKDGEKEFLVKYYGYDKRFNR